MILREVVGVKPGRIESELEATRGKLPNWIISGLHALRRVGNFALHPDKNELTGDVVETEPGEADLTVTLVEALLQHQFAGREVAHRLAMALAARGSQTRSSAGPAPTPKPPGTPGTS